MHFNRPSKKSSPVRRTKALQLEHNLAELKAREAREQRAAQRIRRAQERRVAKKERTKERRVLEQKKMLSSALSLLQRARDERVISSPEFAAGQLAGDRIHRQLYGEPFLETDRLERLLVIASNRRGKVDFPKVQRQVADWSGVMVNPQKLEAVLKRKAKPPADR